MNTYFRKVFNFFAVGYLLIILLPGLVLAAVPDLEDMYGDREGGEVSWEGLLSLVVGVYVLTKLFSLFGIDFQKFTGEHGDNFLVAIIGFAVMCAVGKLCIDTVFYLFSGCDTSFGPRWLFAMLVS